MKIALILTASLLTFSLAHAGHHETKELTTKTVIGTCYSDDGTANLIYADNTDKQKIWLDYIQAHNDRDLEKIGNINAKDWEGYPESGEVIKGNASHIEFLANWFKSPANPKWDVKWMIANRGENNDGVVEHWLTTGNDITFLDDGENVLQHHIHDVLFIGNSIKRINVYARPEPRE